jgi:hypothetical protein
MKNLELNKCHEYKNRTDERKQWEGRRKEKVTWSEYYRITYKNYIYIYMHTYIYENSIIKHFTNCSKGAKNEEWLRMNKRIV